MLRQAHAEARLLPTSLRPHLAPPTRWLLGPGRAGHGVWGQHSGELCHWPPWGCSQEEVDSGRGLGDTPRWGRGARARG